MQTAQLWKPLSDKRVQCRLCSHYCVVEPGQRGECGVRFNKDGEFATLVGDQVAAINIDPVEKKPLYHFMPGTRTFSFGTEGCNLSCTFCQNYTLSQPPKLGGPIRGQTVTPEAMLDSAIRNNCRSMSYTYSEPTIFAELVMATASLGLDKGFKNVLVTNGFQSAELLEAFGPLIQAANVDLKAFTEEFYKTQCGARLAPVLKNLRKMKELGWWVEVTTLVIPGLNDSEAELADIAGFIAGELGRETPWHVSRFHPDYKLTNIGPTPVKTLETAYRIGREKGLDYVYVGNVPGHDGNNTFCPGCKEIAIEREGFRIVATTLKNGVCRCGARVAGVDLQTLDDLNIRRPA